MVKSSCTWYVGCYHNAVTFSLNFELGLWLKESLLTCLILHLFNFWLLEDQSWTLGILSIRKCFMFSFWKEALIIISICTRKFSISFEKWFECWYNLHWFMLSSVLSFNSCIKLQYLLLCKCWYLYHGKFTVKYAGNKNTIGMLSRLNNYLYLHYLF